MANMAVLEKAKKKFESVKHIDIKHAVDNATEIQNKAATPVFVGLTAGSIILSLLLFTRKKKDDAMFVGLWAPTFVGLGLLSKISSMKKEKMKLVIEPEEH